MKATIALNGVWPFKKPDSFSSNNFLSKILLTVIVLFSYPATVAVSIFAPFGLIIKHELSS